MKTLIKFFLFCLPSLYFMPLTANLQSCADHSTDSKKDQKIYIDYSKLHFSEEGIFFEADPDQWIEVKQIGHDSIGYYFGSAWNTIIGTPYMPRGPVYIATCKYCGEVYYNRSPEPCESCNRSAGYRKKYLE